MTKTKKSRRVCISVPERLFYLLEKLAKIEETNKSELTRYAIDKYIVPTEELDRYRRR